MNNDKKIRHKFYFSFEIRVVIMLIFMLTLFGVGCFFITKVISFSKGKSITYDETSDIHYEVCLKKNDIYEDDCLKENMEYISDLTHNMYVTFLYNVKMSDEVPYHLGYHLSGVTRIYDTEDSSKLLYNNEEKLLNSVDISDNSKSISINESFIFDYSKYNKLVLEYQKLYEINSSAEFELILYLEENEEIRSVASIIIPLGTSTYGVKKKSLANLNQEATIETVGWNQNSVFYTIISLVFIISSLIFLYHIARLVLKVTTNRNKYQKELSRILKDNDKLIVNSKNGYQYPKDKRIVKVESFEELLDARNVLKKPIIYSKINDVKSEFVVEDEDKLFLYVLKESDL